MDNHHKEIVFEANRKSKAIAYLLWLFLGWFGVHRFYGGYTKSGITQLLLTLSVVGLPIMLVWLLVDIFLIPGLINDRNMELINTLNYGDPQGLARHQREGLDVGSDAEPCADDPVLDERRQRMLEDLRATGHRKPRRDDFHLYR